MKTKYNSILLAFTLIFISNFGFGQTNEPQKTNEIKIKFIGNCGLHMTDGNLNIYMDFPYKSGAYGYMEYNKTELESIPENSIFIFTHKHADHYSGKIMRKVLKNKNGKKFTQRKVSKLEKFSKTIPDFNVEIFKTKHRFSLNHNSYLITWHGKKLFFSGDTEHPEILEKVSDIHFAFLTPWILTYAQEKNIEIDAETKVLYHLYPNQKLEGEFIDNFIILKNQGEIIKIPY